MPTQFVHVDIDMTLWSYLKTQHLAPARQPFATYLADPTLP
jgi:hypothetical protein